MNLPKRKTILFLISLLLLISGGVGCLYFSRGSGKEEEPSSSVPPQAVGSFFVVTENDETTIVGGFGTVSDLDKDSRIVTITTAEGDEFTFYVAEDTKIQFADVTDPENPVMSEASLADIAVGQEISVFRDPPDSRSGGLVVITRKND